MLCLQLFRYVMIAYMKVLAYKSNFIQAFKQTQVKYKENTHVAVQLNSDAFCTFLLSSSI